MRSFRFLHTADIHLGTPFQGVSTELPQTWASLLKTAAESVFSKIVDIALTEQVDFVTITGDLFDSTETTMAVQFELLRGLERLEENRIPVFMSHGNHDPLVGQRALKWPSNVHVFAAAPTVVPADYQVPTTLLRLDGGTSIQVSGFSYPTPAVYTSFAAAFQRHPDADFAIGLYHGTIGQDTGHANYCPVRVANLQERGFDFWGLGHIHKPQVIQADRPTILYPGNPQGRHIREDGARGCTIVDVAASGDVRLHFVPTAMVEWQKCTVSAETCGTIEAVRTQVISAIADMAQTQQVPVIARIAIEGQTDAHAELLDADLQAILQDELDARHFQVYIERVDVRTTPGLDEDVLIHSDSYAGELLRRFEHYRVDDAELRADLLPELQDVFHAGNELSLDGLTNAELADLLSGAKRRVLKYLAQAAEVAE